MESDAGNADGIGRPILLSANCLDMRYWAAARLKMIFSDVLMCVLMFNHAIAKTMTGAILQSTNRQCGEQCGEMMRESSYLNAKLNLDRMKKKYC